MIDLGPEAGGGDAGGDCRVRGFPYGAVFAGDVCGELAVELPLDIPAAMHHAKN